MKIGGIDVGVLGLILMIIGALLMTIPERYDPFDYLPWKTTKYQEPPLTERTIR